MTPPLDLFEGPVKTAILAALAAAAPSHVYAADLCDEVFGSREKRHRDTLKALVSQMRPKLQALGFDIQGRAVLRMNAYRLVNTLLGDSDA